MKLVISRFLFKLSPGHLLSCLSWEIPVILLSRTHLLSCAGGQPFHSTVHGPAPCHCHCWGRAQCSSEAPWRKPCCDLGCLMSRQTNDLSWHENNFKHHSGNRRSHSPVTMPLFMRAFRPVYYITSVVRLDYARSSSVPAPISDRAASIYYF